MMRTAAVLAVAIALVMATGGCVSQEPAIVVEEAVDATSASTESGDWGEAADAGTKAGAKSDQSYQDGTGWSIDLKGIRAAKLWQSYYEEAKTHTNHSVEKVADKKGVKTSYRGMPLRLAIAMVDGPDTDHAWLFDQELWAKGYDVTIVAKDGYSATFNTKDLASDALIIADIEDGKR
jgi:hypothetical protein